MLRADRQAKARSDRVLLRSGLVGYQLPVLRATTLALAPDDSAHLATDGIDAGFNEGLVYSDSPQQLASASGVPLQRSRRCARVGRALSWNST